MIQAIRIGLGWLTLVLIGASPAFPATPAHQAVQYGEQALAFSSGFIRETLPSDGVVAKTAYNRQVVGHGDTVYLRMKYPDDVAIGSLYTVYRRSRKVFHPANGRYVGNLFSIVGIVRVTKIDNDFATAKIDQGYMWIAPGDMVMPFALSSAEDSTISEPSLPDTTGMVIEIQSPRTLVAQSNIVYLDLGRADGLHPGDRLEVLRSRRGLPTESIGEVKILTMEEITSTAHIVRAIMPIAIGDHVMPKELNRDARVQGAHPVHGRQIPASASTKTRDSLTKSLQTEIAKGDVSVEQIGDKVTISLTDLVNQLEYEPGEARIKPTGIKILKQIGEYLKQDTDNEILVEGHTDNQPIGANLAKYYPTNQELSEARAGLIVRYFMDAGIDPGALTAIGYADTRPVANNEREEGRKRNRRIEIVLTPRQLDAAREEPKPTKVPRDQLKPLESKPTALPSAELEAIEPLHVNVPQSPDTALQHTDISRSAEPMPSN
jgi:chemotaxis protein MotB